MKKNSNDQFNLNAFCKGYLERLNNTVNKIDIKNLLRAAKLIEDTIKKKNYIYVCGNGGSAAIANHYLCDYFKLLSKYTDLRAKIRSLNSDSDLISAISNDISLITFLKYSERYMEKNDILLLISSSGNSKNIKQVLNFCKKKNLKQLVLQILMVVI